MPAIYGSSIIKPHGSKNGAKGKLYGEKILSLNTHSLSIFKQLSNTQPVPRLLKFKLAITDLNKTAEKSNTIIGIEMPLPQVEAKVDS